MCEVELEVFLRISIGVIERWTQSCQEISRQGGEGWGDGKQGRGWVNNPPPAPALSQSEARGETCSQMDARGWLGCNEGGSDVVPDCESLDTEII